MSTWTRSFQQRGRPVGGDGAVADAGFAGRAGVGYDEGHRPEQGEEKESSSMERGHGSRISPVDRYGESITQLLQSLSSR